MFTLALIVVIPLFLYCSYLFAKDIKSSFSMYSFKRNRFKGDNSKTWKPVSLEALKINEEYTAPFAKVNTPTYAAKPLTVETHLAENDEKPVIKLYKDSLSESGKNDSLNNSVRHENLLLKIAKEMRQYDDDVQNLFDAYESKIEKYVTHLIGVELISTDKLTFIYPVEKAGKNKMLCYKVNEAGISEAYIAISELALYNLPPAAYTGDLKSIVNEYIAMQKSAKASLKILQRKVSLHTTEMAGNFSLQAASLG